MLFFKFISGYNEEMQCVFCRKGVPFSMEVI